MRTLAAAALVGVLLGGPLTATAASNSRYTPVDPSSPTLAGSAVVADCRSGKPWIDYRIRVTDPSGGVLAADAVLVLEIGGRAATVPLGALTDGAVSGSVPWPADASAADGGYGTAVIRLEPSVAPSLRLPLAVVDCDPEPLAAALPATGLPACMPALGVVGIGLVAAGTTLGLLRRRREG